MARIRYFSDATGEPVQLHAPHGMDNKEFAARWPGVRGIRYDGYQMLVGHTTNLLNSPVLPLTRKIEFKAQPSLHECNAKCMNGKHNGTCECRCGGKNHGAGLFTAHMQAA